MDNLTESCLNAAWYSVGELAQALRVPEPVIRRLIDAGDLEAIRVADEWRISSVAFAAYARSHASTPKRKQRRPTLLRSLVALAITSTIAASAVILRAQSNGNGPAASLPYHGYLELAGVAVEGKRYLTFTLYDGNGSTTGWSESSTVSISAGHFSALLGAQVALDTVLKSAVPPLLIGLTVQDVGQDGMPTGTPVVLAGRQLIGTSAYARRAAPGGGFQVDGTLEAGGLLSNTFDVAEGGRLRVTGSPGVNGWDVDNMNGALRFSHDGETFLRVTSGGDLRVGDTQKHDLSVTGNVAVGDNLTAATVTSRGDLRAPGKQHYDCYWTDYGCNSTTCNNGYYVAGERSIQGNNCGGTYFSYSLNCCRF
jgi:excisionase family DNA binding protein